MSLYKGTTYIAGIQNLNPLNERIGACENNKVDINSNVIDGQWVVSYLVVCSHVKEIGSYSYNISSYLPDTINTYEVRVSLYSTDDHTSSTTNAWVGVGTTANPFDQWGENSTVPFSSNGLITCGTDTYVDKATNNGTLTFIPGNRNIYMQIAERVLATGACLRLLGYRRIGTNQ